MSHHLLVSLFLRLFDLEFLHLGSKPVSEILFASFLGVIHLKQDALSVTLIVEREHVRESVLAETRRGLELDIHINLEVAPTGARQKERSLFNFDLIGSERWMQVVCD